MNIPSVNKILLLIKKLEIWNERDRVGVDWSRNIKAVSWKLIRLQVKRKGKRKKVLPTNQEKVKKANSVIQGKTNCDYGLFSKSRRQLRRVNECVGWSTFSVGTVNIHSVLNTTCDLAHVNIATWYSSFSLLSMSCCWYSKFLKFFFSQNTIWLYATHSIPTICLSMACGPCGFMDRYTYTLVPYPCPLFLLIFIFIIINNSIIKNICSTEYRKICLYNP